MKFKNIIKDKCIKRPYFAGIMLILFSVLFSSCKKFVIVDLPKDQITGPVVFEDSATANAALVNIYIQLRDRMLVTGSALTGVSNLLGNYADEIQPRNNTLSADNIFFENRLLSSDGTISGIWNNSYTQIYAANAILEGLKQSSKISAQDKERMQGEALFIRAYIHFYLLNLYGAIPYITTTDYRINSTVSKMTIDGVYAAIIVDLKQAKILLPEAYTGTDRVRPNRSVAIAMLARIYLYTQNWALAESEASAVIGNSLYAWVADLDNVFLKGSTGTIWQFIPGTTGDVTLEAQTFNLSDLGNNGIPSRTISDWLLAAFEANDLRKTHWIGVKTNALGIWYYPNKYKQKIKTVTSSEYSILFRLEEQYLIRAEARAKQGDISGSQADLNKIRNRAGLGDTPANTEPTLSTAILKERRVELFTEYGHRFFDLKRTGQANTALAGIKPNWTATDLLWPLPANELLLNPNLRPQNSGYQE